MGHSPRSPAGRTPTRGTAAPVRQGNDRSSASSAAPRPPAALSLTGAHPTPRTAAAYPARLARRSPEAPGGARRRTGRQHNQCISIPPSGHCAAPAHRLRHRDSAATGFRIIRPQAELIRLRATEAVEPRDDGAQQQPQSSFFKAHRTDRQTHTRQTSPPQDTK